MTIRIVWGKSNGRVIAGSDQPAPPPVISILSFYHKIKKNTKLVKKKKKI